MVRLFTTGYETGVVAPLAISGGGGGVWTTDPSIMNTGFQSVRLVQLTTHEAYLLFNIPTANQATGNTTYFRSYWRPQAWPSTNTRMMAFMVGTSTYAQVRINTSHQLFLASGPSTQQGGITPPLNLGQWYCLEASIFVPASGNVAGAFRVNGVAVGNGTWAAGFNAAVGTLEWGLPLGGTVSWNWVNWDDTAINDSTGASDNFWVGPIPPSDIFPLVTPLGFEFPVGVTISGGGGGNTFNQSIVDAISQLDTRLSQMSKPLTDAFSELDTRLSQMSKPETDAFSEVDTRVSQVTKPKTDAISETDILSRGVGKNLVDAFSELDATITRAVGKNLSDAFSEIDTFSRTWVAHQNLVDAISQLDTLLKQVAKTPFKDVISETDVIQTIRGQQRNFTDAHSATDTVIRQVTKSITDTISQLDILTRVWQSHITLQDWVTEFDATAKTVQKPLVDTTSETDVQYKQGGKTLQDVQSALDSSSKGFGKSVGDSTSATDALPKSLTRTIFEALSETDKVTASRGIVIKLLDAVGLTDLLTNNAQHGTGITNTIALAMVVSFVSSVLGATISFGSGVLSNTPSLITTSPLGSTSTLSTSPLSNQPSSSGTLLSNTPTDF